VAQKPQVNVGEITFQLLQGTAALVQVQLDGRDGLVRRRR